MFLNIFQFTLSGPCCGAHYMPLPWNLSVPNICPEVAEINYTECILCPNCIMYVLLGGPVWVSTHFCRVQSLLDLCTVFILKCRPVFLTL